MRQLFFLALIPVTCAAAPMPQVTVVAQRDAEWASYRAAYKAAAGFDQHLATRPLIQAHMQIRPREPGPALQGLQIQLASTSMTMNLPVDGIGRTVLPMLKKPYDEDAVLRLNKPKGTYRFSGRFSIKERDDGVYPVAMLRQACDQLLSAQRAAGSRLRLLGKKCAGIRFVYAPTDSAAAVSVSAAGGAASTIAAIDADPFESAGLGLYKVAIVRFGALPADAEITTPKRPLAIGTVYE